MSPVITPGLRLKLAFPRANANGGIRNTNGVCSRGARGESGEGLGGAGWRPDAAGLAEPLGAVHTDELGG